MTDITLSDEEMVAWANASIDRNKDLAAENEALNLRIAGLEAQCKAAHDEIERLTAELSHWKYIAADYEISSSQQENERLQARVEALEAEHEAGRYISRHSSDETWKRWVLACDAATEQGEIK